MRFIGSAVIAVALAACSVGVIGIETARAEQDSARQYVLGIEGMGCPINCAPAVKEALEGVDGVESVAVDFEDKRAVVRMAPGQSLSQETCDKAFGNSGYFVSSFDEQPADAGDAPES